MNAAIDLAEMQRRIAEMEAAAGPKPDTTADADASPEFAYKPLSCEEIVALPTILERVRGIFPEAGLSVVYGISGSAKTFLVLDLGFAIVNGACWFGRKTIQANVLYVYLESTRAIKKRLKAWQEAFNGPFPAGLSFILDDFDLQNPEHVRALIAAARQSDSRVIIVDTLNRASLGSDENSSRDRGLIIRACSEIQAATDSLVILVAHAGKNKDQGLRGHSSLFAALDAVIQVDRRADGSRYMKIEKSKEGIDGEVFNFQLTPVVIGTDQDGNEITSCVVEPLGAGAKDDKPLTPALKYGLDSLTKACEAEGKPGVHLEVWRQAFYAGHTGDNMNAKRQAFYKARNGLIERGIISVADDIYTVTALPSVTGALPDTQAHTERLALPSVTHPFRGGNGGNGNAEGSV
ncbi:MAG: helicase RepA family protein [Betaproteobacteria bacterium]|nr:helicase RepA family protein [Betaproteobacteria bacterium]